MSKIYAGFGPPPKEIVGASRILVNNSRLRAYNRCARYYETVYVHNLVPHAAGSGLSMALGSTIHYGDELLIKTGRATVEDLVDFYYGLMPDELDKRDHEEWHERIDWLQQVWPLYVERWAQDGRILNIGASETPIWMLWESGVLFMGILDGLVETEDAIFTYDTKTSRMGLDRVMGQNQMAYQHKLYAEIVAMMAADDLHERGFDPDKPVRGLYLNYVSTKTIPKPRTKDGHITPAHEKRLAEWRDVLFARRFIELPAVVRREALESLRHRAITLYHDGDFLPDFDHCFEYNQECFLAQYCAMARRPHANELLHRELDYVDEAKGTP